MQAHTTKITRQQWIESFQRNLLSLKEQKFDVEIKPEEKTLLDDMLIICEQLLAAMQTKSAPGFLGLPSDEAKKHIDIVMQKTALYFAHDKLKKTVPTGPLAIAVYKAHLGFAEEWDNVSDKPAFARLPILPPGIPDYKKLTANLKTFLADPQKYVAGAEAKKSVALAQ